MSDEMKRIKADVDMALMVEEEKAKIGPYIRSPIPPDALP